MEMRMGIEMGMETDTGIEMRMGIETGREAGTEPWLR